MPLPHLCFSFDIPCSLNDALKKQEHLFHRSVEKDTWDFIIFAEHAPVYTYTPGKLSDEQLFRNGDPLSLSAPLVAVRRGGAITFHGPGQLVCYFIFDLARRGIGVLQFTDAIDMALCELLLRFGIRGKSKPLHLPSAANGIWVESADGREKKIASRGLLVRQGYNPFHLITRFGCALNISTDLRMFAPIYPCGLEIEMTSVKEEAGQSPDLRDTAYAFSEIFSKNLGHFGEGAKEKRHSS